MKYIKTYENNNWLLKEFIDAIYKDAEYYDDIKSEDNGLLKRVKYYVFDRKIDINGKYINVDNGSEETPLHKVIHMYDFPKYVYAEKIAIFLINNGADVNIKTSYGSTPLMLATSIGSVRIVKKLIEKDADVDAQDKYGNTAFIEGINTRYGFNQQEVGELIKAGADWFLANNKGEYPYKLLRIRLGDYGMKNTIAKLYPEEYENAVMIANAKKYNL